MAFPLMKAGEIMAYSESSDTIKHKLAVIFVIFCLLVVSNIAQAKSWHFVEWVTDITINSDSTFLVRETQTVQFEGQFSFLQRGIALRKLKKISDIHVYDANWNPLPPEQIEMSRSGNEKIVKINFQAQDEVKTWTFEYIVHGGIGFFKDYDELYWNAISEKRDVPVDKVIAVVRFPQDVSASELKQKLFLGPTGSTDESMEYSVVDKRTVVYWGDNISPYTNFTVVTAFPKSIVQKDWWLIISSYLWLIIPLVTFGFLFWLWWNKGRDPRAKETIIPQYEPPEGLSPAEMSVVVHERLHTKDISATLIDLACRGYLKIIETEKSSKDYIFQKQNKTLSDNILKPHEKLVLKGIFGFQEEVNLGDLKEKFYTNIPGIKKALLNQVTQDGYFKENPSSVMAGYVVLGILLIIASIVVTILHLVPFTGLFALVLAGIMIIIFGQFMPCRTLKGADAKWHAIGFKDYLQVAERFRLDSNVDPKIFDKYLSYALVLNVAKKWAERFSDIYRESPDWYVSSYDSGTYSFVYFSINMSNMMDSFSSVLPSSPSSSSGSGGGGSSGGGGGGGSSSAG